MCTMEVAEAAKCLFDMKHTKLDTETARNLRNLIQSTRKRKFLETRSASSSNYRNAPRPIFPASSSLPSSSNYRNAPRPIFPASSSLPSSSNYRNAPRPIFPASSSLPSSSNYRNAPRPIFPASSSLPSSSNYRNAPRPIFPASSSLPSSSNYRNAPRPIFPASSSLPSSSNYRNAPRPIFPASSSLPSSSNYKNAPRPIFPASSSLSIPEIKRQKVENKNENENRIEIADSGENGVFKADEQFIEKLNRGEIILTKLPPLGEAIDGITLPKLPPIESLKGQISNCTAPFEKQLTMSDLNVGQARLAFCGDSVKCILKKFMKEREYARVINENKKGLEVTVYDQKGRAYEMTFVLWASKMHVLTRGWKEFYLGNGFEINLDWVTVWMFRHSETGKLCFAIVARRLPTATLIGKTQKNGKKNKMQKLED